MQKSWIGSLLHQHSKEKRKWDNVAFPIPKGSGNLPEGQWFECKGVRLDVPFINRRIRILFCRNCKTKTKSLVRVTMYGILKRRMPNKNIDELNHYFWMSLCVQCAMTYFQQVDAKAKTIYSAR